MVRVGGRINELYEMWCRDEQYNGWHNVRWLKEYNICQTTFLTREQAKKALKELENNG